MGEKKCFKGSKKGKRRKGGGDKKFWIPIFDIIVIYYPPQYNRIRGWGWGGGEQTNKIKFSAYF